MKSKCLGAGSCSNEQNPLDYARSMTVTPSDASMNKKLYNRDNCSTYLKKYENHVKLVGSWTNPSEQYYIVKMDHFPRDWGGNKHFLKPPRKYPNIISIATPLEQPALDKHAWYLECWPEGLTSFQADAGSAVRLFLWRTWTDTPGTM